MSGEGWWSDERGVKGVWMYLSPPPQMTVLALENTEHLGLDKKLINLLAHTDAGAGAGWCCSTSSCVIFYFIHYHNIYPLLYKPKRKHNVIKKPEN